MNVVSVVESNNIRILQLLIAVPGSVPKGDLDRAVIIAVKLGLTECLEILIQHGADHERQDSLGNSLLKVAAEEGQVHVMPCLIKAGCSVNHRNHAGMTALHYAASHGHDKVVSLLLRHGARTLIDSGGNTPLLLAAQNCNKCVQVMKVLVNEQCAINAQDKRGKTALHYTSQKAIGVGILLAAGADPNIQDTNRNTPLMLAATEGFDNVIISLLQFGADPDVMNSSQKAALHFLAMKNHWMAIEAIANGHGNVDLIDGDMNRPLWYAVFHNRPEAVKALLRANCSPDPVYNNGKAIAVEPLHAALEKKLYGIAKLLVLSGCRLDPLYTWLNIMEHNAEHDRTPQYPYLFAQQEESDEEEDEEEAEALEWFKDWVHTPHSLRQICRIWIRQHIGSGIVRKGDFLPVPPSIRDYITLREVDDHHVTGMLL